jgi:3-hydroxyacyl-CoA dehydrogenase/enoyl-CoA hydratase/3-hydroxybutyryl-CoA epimerase
MVYAMVNEAARCLEEGVVKDASEIDIGMIFGTGFAPFRGGLLRYADSVGIDSIVSDLEVFVRSYGMRFQPCQLLQQMAVGGKKFYE